MSYIPLQYRLVPVDLTYSGEYEKIFGVTEQAQKIEGTLVLTALDAGVGAYECEIEAALPNLKKKATIKYLKGEVVGPTSVSIGEDFSMTVDDEYDVSADLEIAAPEGADKSVTFTSSNPEVLEVDGTILTAKKAGTATLRVEAAVGGQSDECQVIVYDKPTGIKIYLNGSLLSKDAPILFEVGDEKTFEAKILPETADQSLWSVTYDPNQDIFENSGTDLTFRALKAGTLEVEISTDIASYAKTITLKVEEPFTLTPSVTESLAGSAVTITSNKKVVSWEKTYSTSNVLGLGAGTITSTSDTEAKLLLPLIVNTRTSKPINSTMTITATDEEGNTATCEVVSKGWYVRYYDSSSQSELTGTTVSAEQQVVVVVVDYQGNIITRANWSGSITATVSDGVEFVQNTPNSVIYEINSGSSSYVFTFAANDDNTVKNIRTFTLN